MTRKLLLGTTALAGLGALIAVTPASAIETSVGGYARWGVVFGEVDTVTGNPKARNFYFREEFEVHVNAKGKDDATGTEYGVQVQLETDRGSDDIKVDEQWIWLKGNWGEVRLGNEDGAADLMKITAGSIAAGTGGIDGWFNVVAPVGIHLLNSSDASKIVYFTPNISGFEAGISFTPDSGQFGADLPRHNDGHYENWIEAGAAYTADMGGAKFRVGGQFSRADHEVNGFLDFTGYSLGAQVEVSGIKVAGSWARNSFDNPNDNTRWTLGVGAALGPANVSITGVKEFNDNSSSDPRNIVLSGDVTLLPGVALQGDVAFWDLDTGGNDNGVTGVLVVRVGM
ncbi:hypothetical protein HRbin39_01482 [bacterium HR39]|nr:hypothetical protein HRbin39_01482 [bacterium HR39]